MANYMNPYNLLESNSISVKNDGLATYNIGHESYFSEAMDFIARINEEYATETKTFYRALVESNNDVDVINESFSDFFVAVKKLIDKFLAFIKRLVAKFITSLNSLVKSDKYIIKHKGDFSKFNTNCEFSFDGYTYTFNTNVPVINALAEFNGEGISGTPGADFFSAFTKEFENQSLTKSHADKIAEKIAAKYQELTESLNGDYYDIFRARVLNKDGFIPQEDFAAECLAVFRNDTTDKEPIDVTSIYVTETLARFIGNEKYYKSVEKDKKRIEKEYNEIKKILDKLITVNYDKKITSILRLPNGEVMEASKATELIHQMDLFVKAKSVQVQEMSNIHALAFAAKLDAIKESHQQGRAALYKALSKIQGTIKESNIVGIETIEDDLFNDYVDPVDDQEIIDAIIDGRISDEEYYGAMQEAHTGIDPAFIRSVSACDKKLDSIKRKRDKFQRNYDWYNSLDDVGKKSERNKKKLQRILSALLFGLVGLGITYGYDIKKGNVPAGILRNPDGFYKKSLMDIDDYIDRLEKRKKELQSAKNEMSYDDTANNFNMLQERIWEQYTVEQAISEAIALTSNKENAINEISILNEGAMDKMKQLFKKLIEFIKSSFAKFVEATDRLLAKDTTYLEKYKNIILKKPLKEATYTMPNYDLGIKNLTSVSVPLFNYEQMKDEWLESEAKFCEKVFQGKTPNPLASLNFSENCHMIFRGSNNTIEYKHTDLNMTDIYTYCYEYKKMQTAIEKDKKTIETSYNNVEKFIDQVEAEFKTNESTYSFLYGSVITEADDAPKGGVKIDNGKTTQTSTTAAANMENIDKNSEGDTKETIKNNASNKDELTEIRKKLSIYSSCCSTLFSTKLSIAEEIYKAYMQIITNHVKNYVGATDKSTKTADAGTDYSKKGNDQENQNQNNNNNDNSNNNQQNDQNNNSGKGKRRRFFKR